MSFYDYWLKGNTEEEIANSLRLANISLLPTTESSYDPVGHIWVDGLTADLDGNTPQVLLDGWHANLRMCKPLTPSQLEILRYVLIEEPKNPARIWM